MARMKFKKKTITALTEMTNLIDNKDRIPLVTFIIDKTANSFLIIGGKSDSPMIISVPFKDQDPTLKTGKWSIDAGMFKEYIQDYSKLHKDSQELILEIDEKSKTDRYIIGYTNDNAVRRWKINTPCKEHLDYFLSLSDKAFQVIPKSALELILQVAKDHSPLELIKVDSTQNKIFIQHESDISTVTLQKDSLSKLKIDLIANQNSLDTIKYICENTESNTLMINTDNENLTITDGKQTLSCSLNSPSEFNHKIHYTEEIKFIVNIKDIKSETRAYININQIKSNNTSLFYFTQNNAYISGIGFTVESFQNLSADYISAKESYLYNIDLRKLLEVKFNKITKLKKITLRVLKGTDGSRKLAFYNEYDAAFPHTLIPIELNTNNDDLKAMQELRLIYNKQTQQNGGKQIDLLGFEDI